MKKNFSIFANPPRLGKWLLKKLISRNVRYQAVGDFDELFFSIYEDKGYLIACCWYWMQILISVPSFLFDKIHWGGIMLKNYFIVAVRNIKRHLGFSLINILGLAVGLATCILIMMFVRLETTYDSYHDGADRIYRVGIRSFEQKGIHYRTTNLLHMRDVLAEDYSQVEAAGRFMTMYEPSVSYKDKIFREYNIYRADQDFFDVFSVNFLIGDEENALTKPGTVVLNESIAEKYFGNSNPIGKVLKIDDTEFEVTAVVENQPANSIFQFDALTTWKSLPQREHFIGWHALVMPAATYVKLIPGVDKAEFEKTISDIPAQYIGQQLKELGLEYYNYIQPLEDLHLYNITEAGVEITNSLIYVYIFASIGFLILLLACINFINLSTARSTIRACEVGMRKVIGAKRSSIIQQFLGESLIISIASMIIAVSMVILLIPIFNEIAGTRFTLGLLSDPVIILSLLLVVIFVGLISGSYPALFLSAFQPISVLRGIFKLGSKGSNLRRVLVVGQFAISIILVTATLTIFDQVNYMKERPLGFEKELKLALALKNWEVIENNYEMVKEEFEKHPSIISASVSSGVPGRMINRLFVNPSRDPNSTGLGPNILRCDFDFMDVYKIKLLAGIDRKIKGIPDELYGHFFINETAMRKFGYNNPKDAVGKPLYIGSSRSEYKILGVVKDFHWFGLQNKIDATIMRFVPLFRYVSLNISNHDIKETLEFIKDKYSQLFPGDVYEYFFVDKDFDRQYKREESLGRIFSTFTFLGLFIACLGLFGLASFIAERKTKEIGIRKVMGASVTKIVYLLNKEFMIWIIIANITAWPAAYYLIDTWLQFNRIIGKIIKSSLFNKIL
ncbi:ABC transporter permease [Bacteroidota bacterium]